MTSFEETLGTIPYNATSSNGTGFLPPFFRAMMHLLTAAQRVKDSKSKNIQEYMDKEVADASVHLSLAIETANTQPIMSRNLRETLSNFHSAFPALRTYLAEETEPEKQIEALRNLTHRGAVIMSMMDRQILGLTNTDPGFSL